VHETTVPANVFISVVQKTIEDCVPAHKVACTEHNVPGWSEYVKENHANAQTAFLEWIYDGKPLSGVFHTRMCTTRAKFKLPLQYCRRHVDHLRSVQHVLNLNCSGQTAYAV